MSSTRKIIRSKPVVKKYYEAIPVSQLRVDPNLDAQRMFQPKWANRLAKIWDPRWSAPRWSPAARTATISSTVSTPPRSRATSRARTSSGTAWCTRG